MRAAEKEAVVAELKAVGTSVADSDSDGLAGALSRLPDLSEALRQASPALKRRMFEAFCREVRYDKLERRIEISATASEAVAQAFENAKDLPQEVSRVTLRDIAGAGFEPATFGL